MADGPENISGLWLFRAEDGAEFVYEFAIHDAGRVTGQARPANAAWTTTIEGSLRGEQLCWTETTRNEDGKQSVGRFSCTFAKDFQGLSGSGQPAAGGDLWFDGAKAQAKVDEDKEKERKKKAFNRKATSGVGVLDDGCVEDELLERVATEDKRMSATVELDEHIDSLVEAHSEEDRQQRKKAFNRKATSGVGVLDDGCIEDELLEGRDNIAATRAASKRVSATQMNEELEEEALEGQEGGTQEVAVADNTLAIVPTLADAKQATRAKSPRSQTRESTLCAWRSRQPVWNAERKNPSADSQAKYWNDKSYSDFYNASPQERHTLMNSTAGAGLAASGTAKLNASWRRNGAPAPPTSPLHRAALRVGSTALQDEGVSGRQGTLSDRKAARFQQVFAELSSGGCSITVSQAPTLLRNLGVPQPQGATEKHLPEVLSAQASIADSAAGAIVPTAGKFMQKLGYDDALRLYEQVLLPEVALAAVCDAVDEFAEEAMGGTVATAIDEHLGSSPRPAKLAELRKDRPLAPAPPTAPSTSPRMGARDEKYNVLYRLPPKSSPRNASIFRKVGQFTVRPSDV